LASVDQPGHYLAGDSEGEIAFNTRADDAGKFMSGRVGSASVRSPHQGRRGARVGVRSSAPGKHAGR
jgi:hypothetical protein